MLPLAWNQGQVQEIPAHTPLLLNLGVEPALPHCARMPMTGGSVGGDEPAWVVAIGMHVGRS